MTDASRPTVLFDIDGTLTDTTYLQVQAWRRAFLDHGLDVASAAIHRHIGMGASMLMEDLVGEARQDVKDAWRRHFDELKPEIRALAGAKELLVEVAGRGGQVVLATSSEPDDVEALLAAISANDAIDVVTSAGDVDEAKPSPEVFQVALQQAGAQASSAVVVGDTPWDVAAARRADLGCVGVRSGGISAAELEEAGALAVYEDPADLLEHLDDSPLGQLLAQGRLR
ncbi:MAG: HAD family hydrolase [Actinomycetota bacterium]|nr:HAD family hydrolase [Actinomycetota bacterium]MDQ3353906.1 HAD family hydrolase [Actinomycetota bacterium]